MSCKDYVCLYNIGITYCLNGINVSKSNTITTIATVVGVIIAGVTLYETVYNKKQSTHSQSQKTEVTNVVAPSQQKHEPVAVLSVNCGEKYTLVDNSISEQSLGFKKDEGYEKAVISAIKDSCFNEAYLFAEKLSLGFKKDEYHEKIYLGAIEAKEFAVAKKSISKLSLGFKRDEGLEALSNAMVSQ